MPLVVEKALSGPSGAVKVPGLVTLSFRLRSTGAKVKITIVVRVNPLLTVFFRAPNGDLVSTLMMTDEVGAVQTIDINLQLEWGGVAHSPNVFPVDVDVTDATGFALPRQTAMLTVKAGSAAAWAQSALGLDGGTQTPRRKRRIPK